MNRTYACISHVGNLPSSLSNAVDAILALSELGCDAEAKAAAEAKTAGVASLLHANATEQKDVYLQHTKTGMFIHPIACNADSLLAMYPALVGPSGLFCFRLDGNIQHVQSGHFVQPLKCSAKSGVLLALHPDGPKPEWAFEIDSAGCLRHSGSGLFVHPASGKGTQGSKLMLHHDGPDRAVSGEIAFKFEPKCSGDQFAAALAAITESETASSVFCEVVECLWAAVLSGDASSESTAASAVHRTLALPPLNTSNIDAHKFVPQPLFKLLTETALDVTLPVTTQSTAAATRIVECLLKALILKPLALRLHRQHLLEGLFDPLQEFITDQHLRAAFSNQRAPARSMFPWTVRTALQRNRGVPHDLIPHLRTDSFTAQLSSTFSTIDVFCVFVPSILASVCSSFASCLPAIFCMVPFALQYETLDETLDHDSSLGDLTTRGRDALHKCCAMSPLELHHALEAFGFSDSDFGNTLTDAASVIECVAKSSDQVRKLILREVLRTAMETGKIVKCLFCSYWFLQRHTVTSCKSRCVCL